VVINAKYDIGDAVAFLYAEDPRNDSANVKMLMGIIKQVNIMKNADGIKISYFVNMWDENRQRSGGDTEIDEEFLYKDEKDLSRLFRKNLREFLSPENIRVVRSAFKEEDDLPF
jgi:hypothetical protein